MIVGSQPYEIRSFLTERQYGPDGRALPQAFVARAGRGTVNPIPGSKRAHLPEGERQGDQIRILTRDEMTPADDANQIVGDIVVWNGRMYRVITEQIYTRVIPHNEYRALWTGETV